MAVPAMFLLGIFRPPLFEYGSGDDNDGDDPGWGCLMVALTVALFLIVIAFVVFAL